MDKWDPGHAAWLSRGRRHAVELDAVVMKSDGSEVPSCVTDLSLDGCRLTGDFTIGEHVTVNIARLGQFPAQIRWALLKNAGARFTRDAATGEASIVTNEKGVAAIEYAMIAALIALAIVAALSRTGEAVGTHWNDVDAAMPGGTTYTT